MKPRGNEKRTKLLVRLFIRNADQTEDPAVRSRYGAVAGIVGILCNLVLFLGKLVIGTVSGSVSIRADAVNNLSDASSNIVTLVAFRLAGKPEDAEHPYGHARIEYLSGLAVAAMILVIGVELAKESLHKILHPEPVNFSWALVAVLVLSIGVKLWMAVFNRSLGKKIKSTSLMATAADSRNDVITTGAVLLAAVVARLITGNHPFFKNISHSVPSWGRTFMDERENFSCRYRRFSRFCPTITEIRRGCT